MHRFSAFAAASLVALVAIIAAPRPPRAEVVIAVAGPMTGDRAEIGAQMRRGAELAVKELNAKGGVNGQRIRLIVGDDGCNPVTAMRLADRLLQRGVRFVAGHFCAGASIPASEIYARRPVLMISPGTTNPALTEIAAARGWRHVLRISARYDAQGPITGAFIAKEFDGKRIAILHDRTAYGREIARAVRDHIRRAGGKEATFKAFAAGEPDYAPLIEWLKLGAYDVLYLAGHHVDIANILRQARKDDYRPQVISADAIATDEFWRASGIAGTDVLVSVRLDPRQAGDAQRLVERLRGSNAKPTRQTIHTYAAVQVWAEAARRTRSFDTRMLAAAIRRGSFATAAGRLTFDERGDVRNPRFVWKVWKDGKLVDR
jgi:branched-chain amino acid transport system substrate-binding protein